MTARSIFFVRLRLFSTEDGGRRTAIGKRHMVSCNIGATFRAMPVFNDARILLEDAVALAPGAETRARLDPLSPDLWTHVQPGFTFTVHDGRRAIGEAEVLERFEEQ